MRAEQLVPSWSAVSAQMGHMVGTTSPIDAEYDGALG